MCTFEIVFWIICQLNNNRLTKAHPLRKQKQLVKSIKKAVWRDPDNNEKQWLDSWKGFTRPEGWITRNPEFESRETWNRNWNNNVIGQNDRYISFANFRASDIRHRNWPTISAIDWIWALMVCNAVLNGPKKKYTSQKNKKMTKLKTECFWSRVFQQRLIEIYYFRFKAVFFEVCKGEWYKVIHQTIQCGKSEDIKIRFICIGPAFRTIKNVV